jgi:hypothetical protein
LGARNKVDFVGTCREDWEQESADLTASDLRVALDVCDDTSKALLAPDTTCDVVMALYLPQP